MNKMQIHLAVQAFRSAFQKQMQAVNRLIRAHKEMPETVTLYEVECALEYWVIFTHRTLEAFILDSLLWTLNRNHHLLELATGGRVKVPALTLGTWNYLVEGDEYFDLKDYGDLVQRLKAFLPYERSLNGTFNQAKTHPFFLALEPHRKSINMLSALRNLAAHASESAKQTAFRGVPNYRGTSCGKHLLYKGKSVKRAEDLRVAALNVGLALAKASEASVPPPPPKVKKKAQRQFIYANIKAQASMAADLTTEPRPTPASTEAGTPAEDKP